VLSILIRAYGAAERRVAECKEVDKKDDPRVRGSSCVRSLCLRAPELQA
jgi:hypothetical protein